jgi:glutathione S-transferase
MVELYTFAVSHYSEKARWALDFKGVGYRERKLLPGLHMKRVRRLAPRTTVPVLRDGEQVIQGSMQILDYAEQRWPDPPLMPLEEDARREAVELERWLDVELGETLRRVFYFHALSHPDLVVYLFAQGGPWWGRWFYRAAFPKVASAIRRLYAITEETASADQARVSAAFQRLDQLLKGRRYLVGDRFSRADLTLAALAAPLWLPPEHPTRWPPAELYPPVLQRRREELGRHLAREHVLAMYRAHRAPSPRPLSVSPGQPAAMGAR